MPDDGIGDFFITDVDDDLDDEDLLSAPVVIQQAPLSTPSSAPSEGAPLTIEAPARPAAEGVALMTEPAAPIAPVSEAAPPAPPSAAPHEAARPASREARLAAALDGLMNANPDIEASALVSLDGFTMASALPSGMQEDRVGAMSAAILGLGERAAAELGRGGLSQVYIEGTDGFVVLISAGGRAVLTALASGEARLGLVLYDMRHAAEAIGSILS